jgi:outer membrane protein TolC
MDQCNDSRLRFAIARRQTLTAFLPLAGPATDLVRWSLKTGAYEYRDWWRAFRDPVLDRLIAIAYEQNLTLLSAGTKVLQARALLGIAIGELYPQQQQGVGAVAYNLRSLSNPTVIPATAAANFWLASLGAQAAWQLDLWGKFRRGVESGDANYLASIATYDDVLVTLLGKVAQIYVGIRTLEKQIAIARANVVRSGQAMATMEEVAAKTLPSDVGYEWSAMPYQEKVTGTLLYWGFVGATRLSRPCRAV